MTGPTPAEEAKGLAIIQRIYDSALKGANEALKRDPNLMPSGGATRDEIATAIARAIVEAMPDLMEAAMHTRQKFDALSVLRFDGEDMMPTEGRMPGDG